MLLLNLLILTAVLCTAADVNVPCSSRNSNCFENVEIKNLDEECDDDGECTVENSVCKPNGAGQGHCTCNDNFVANQANNKCLPHRAKLEEECEESQQCQVEFSQCLDAVGSFKCLCSGSDLIGNTDKTKCLIRREKLEEECEDDIQCSVENSVCTERGEGAGKKNVCFCKDEFFGDESLQQCHAKKDLESPCESDMECLTENSRCLLNKCSCIDNYYGTIDLKQCLPKKTMGVLCDRDVECLDEQSACVKDGAFNRCNCNSPLVASDNKRSCLERKNFDQECTDISQCVHNLRATCRQSDVEGSMEKICNCTLDALRQNQRCLPLAHFGETCEVTEQCTTANSSCIDSICNCTNNHVLTSDRKTCLKKVALEEDCEDSIQCPGDGIQIQCFGDDEVKKCQCLNGTVENANRDGCVAPKMMDDSCTDDLECLAVSPNSACIRSRCDCNENSTRIDVGDQKTCYENKGLNEACQTSDQCKAERSHCTDPEGGIEKRCICVKGFETDEENGTCNGVGLVGAQLGILILSLFIMLKV